MLRVVNESLELSVVPACLKMAVIFLILKKPSLCVNNLRNFHPVSNLPFLGKVIKKVVAAQLSSHLSAHSIPDPMQSAYRPGHSMGRALLKIQDDINRGPDGWGQQSACSLGTLSGLRHHRPHHPAGASGDCGWHPRGCASYLHDRAQSVIINWGPVNHCGSQY